VQQPLIRLAVLAVERVHIDQIPLQRREQQVEKLTVDAREIQPRHCPLPQQVLDRHANLALLHIPQHQFEHLRQASAIRPALPHASQIRLVQNGHQSPLELFRDTRGADFEIGSVQPAQIERDLVAVHFVLELDVVPEGGELDA